MEGNIMESEQLHPIETNVVSNVTHEPNKTRTSREKRTALMSALRSEMKKNQPNVPRTEDRLPVDSVLLTDSSRALSSKDAKNESDYISEIANMLMRIRSQMIKCHTFVAREYSKNHVLGDLVRSCMQDICGTALIWLLDNLGEQIDTVKLNDSATMDQGEASKLPPLSKHALSRLVVLVPTENALAAQQKELSKFWTSMIVPIIEYYKQIFAAQRALEGELRRVSIKVTPNLANLCGSDLAGLLLGLTGSAMALGKLSSNEIMNIGNSYSDHDQSIAHVAQKRLTIIEQSEIVSIQENEQDKKTLARCLASKIPLAARVDAFSDASSSALKKNGHYGGKLQQELLDKFHKRNTREQADEVALPRPEARQTAKRGGWKARLRRKRAQEIAQISKDTVIQSTSDDVSTTMDWYD